MARGVPLPAPTTRINMRVYAADWAYINAHRPGEANEIIRDLLAAWVRHQQARRSG